MAKTANMNGSGSLIAVILIVIVAAVLGIFLMQRSVQTPTAPAQPTPTGSPIGSAKDLNGALSDLNKADLNGIDKGVSGVQGEAKF
jgi:hypothetical protein